MWVWPGWGEEADHQRNEVCRKCGLSWFAWENLFA